MKRIFNITQIIFALIALAFVILISRTVPKNKFAPYILQLDSLWAKENTQQEYLIDIIGNKKITVIRHHNINISGHSIEFQQDEKILQVHIFEYGERFIGKYLKFADIDGNSSQELIFISAKESLAYLNIFSYNANTKEILPIKRIEIDTIKKFNGEMDAVNNFIVTSSSDIYLDLQGSYSVQPRNIYKYNFKNKELIKTELNSLVIPKVSYFNYQNHNYLLATFVRATSNTLSPIDAEMLRTSTDKDTLAMYEKYKYLEYEYGDFSSYILLYNDSLRFAFEPIEFFAWTNFTKATLVPINDVPHIIAFTNAQMDEPDHQKYKLITICNLQGEIIKQIPLPHDYSDIYSENEKVIFYGDKTLFITNVNLKPINEIKNITYAHGYVDIDNDTKSEFVAFTDNILTIYSADFEINASFKIKQEFNPYPEEYSFAILQTGQENSFIFNSRLFYYKFNYEKNNIAFLKYPFFIMVFLVVFVILFLVFRFNSKRLEKENWKLEKIVTERTKEIVSQKQEIQTQAEELIIKNTNLIDLNEFKKLMTGTIIHDLKNPLNHIVGTTTDKTIRQSGFNMLNIVLNVLDINKAQTTDLNINLGKQNIEELIGSAIFQVEYLAEQKNIEFEKIIKNEFCINADKDLTIRILVNLLTNAIKFSSLNKKITIQVTENKKLAQIDIIDYGKGISPENIDKLFKEYSQIEAKKSGKIKSTGLGLIFCKIATEAQNAKIIVSSIPNNKTTFSLIFPVISVTEKKIIKTKCNKIEALLTDKEREKIQPTLLKLKEIEIYRATEILNLLNIIENSSENIKLWKQKITIAMYAMNDELYLKLIDNEL